MSHTNVFQDRKKIIIFLFFQITSDKHDRREFDDLACVFYPVVSYAFLSFLFMSEWGNFIMYANKLAQTIKFRRLGHVLNTVRFNILINALNMESKHSY